MSNVLCRRAARLSHVPLFLLACARFLCAPAVHAAEPPSPEQAAAPAPFERYQGWRDEPLLDWRAVNDRVGEVGGWRTYLREAQPESGDAAGQHDHRGH